MIFKGRRQFINLITTITSQPLTRPTPRGRPRGRARQPRSRPTAREADTPPRPPVLCLLRSKALGKQPHRTLQSGATDHQEQRPRRLPPASLAVDAGHCCPGEVPSLTTQTCTNGTCRSHMGREGTAGLTAQPRGPAREVSPRTLHSHRREEPSLQLSAQPFTTTGVPPSTVLLSPQTGHGGTRRALKTPSSSPPRGQTRARKGRQQQGKWGAWGSQPDSEHSSSSLTSFT